MDIIGNLRNLLEFLKYGIEYESKVFGQYQNYFKYGGYFVKIFFLGFVVNFVYLFFGCLFDVKVIDEIEENLYGIVEIKCFYKY